MSAYYRCVGAYRCALLNEGRAIFCFSRYMTTWIDDIREHHARSTEHIVFQGHAVIDRHVVLNLNVVTDQNLVAYEYVLTHGAIPADFRACAYVHPMPYAGAFSNLRTVVNDRSGMYQWNCRTDEPLSLRNIRICEEKKMSGVK